ncbi:MAG: hypothetical protein KJZ74_14215 [Gemmatimonadales bacterium]|nr:hypothetical protein [Gemmatimonadales bacterium]
MLLVSCFVGPVSIASAQPGAPTITVTPGPGEYSVGTQLSVTVEYCDNNGLDTANVITKFNNVEQTSWPKVYTIGNPGPCLAKLVRTGTVTLVTGTNVLRASIEDTSNPPLWSGWSITEWTTPLPWSGVRVTSNQRYADAPPSTQTTQSFVVTNIGEATESFTFSAAVTGLTLNSGPTPGSSNLAAGASTTVSVVVTSPGTSYNSGRVWLKASAGANADSSFTEVTAQPAPTISNGVTLVNPTGIIERDLCVTIAAGPSAAMECGDLRLSHVLPGVQTRGKGRAPTLTYLGHAAHPWPVFPANFGLVNGGPKGMGTTIAATVVITAGPSQGTSFSAGTWLKADWGSGTSLRRILPTFDASNLPTGRYPYRLDVTSGTNTWSAYGVMLLVSRVNSPFNNGWWLAGLEEIKSYYASSGAADTLMWVGGDGSARTYIETAATSCIFLAEALDRPDSIVATSSSGTCIDHVRKLPNNTRVVFNGTSGQHRYTINRLSDTTSFVYDGSARLDSIKVPSGSVAVAYRFFYTGSRLDSVRAPSLPVPSPDTVRAVRFTTSLGASIGGAARPRIVKILGPDTTRINFDYDALGSSTDYWVGHRYERDSIPTTFSWEYASALRLVGASTPASATQTVSQTFRPAEGQGMGTGSANQSIPLDSIYTRLDGPRTDVTDVHKWWINKYGAPVRYQDPMGMGSRITYDYAWPGLPFEVVDAAGMVTRAYYDSRGLVGTTVRISPFGGANDTTKIWWNPSWSLPDSTRDGNGVKSHRRYDASSGNLMREWVGADSSRRTLYGFDATTKQLRAVFTAGVNQADSIEYDATLRNVQRTKSAGGVVQWFHKDRIGRDTLTLSPADTIAGQHNRLQQRRIVYDGMSRVKEVAASAPAMPYTLILGVPTLPTDTAAVAAETLFTKTTYDRVGRVSTVNTYSRPNYGAEIECVLHCNGAPSGTYGSWDVRSYDWLGRPLWARLGSGPQSVEYDPAGNVISQLTKNGHTITATYDAANRLVKRIVPALTFSQEDCSYFAYGMLHGVSPSFFCWMVFPVHPNSGTSLVVAADTARFAYDYAGRMSRADNKDARVSRSYYASGALKTDTLRTRSAGTNSFTATVFGQSYAYDIGGRRITHTLPTNSALNDGTISYTYDSERGLLSEVAHSTSRLRFKYDLAGRQDTLRVHKVIGGSDTLGVVESRSYDSDGQLTILNRQRREGAYFVGLLTDTMRYDARGKLREVLVASASVDVGNQRIRNYYAGLGAVVGSEKANSFSEESEQFRATAMGTVWRSRSDIGASTDHYPQISFFGFNGELKGKNPVRPYQNPLDSLYTDTAYTQLDAGGNVIRSGAVFQRATTEGDRYYTATRSYYSADNKLVVVQRYHAMDAARSGAWEEFRYDALGRRVLSRTRRGGASPKQLCTAGECPEWVERYVWDGDQILYELRRNGNDTTSLDNLTSSGAHWGKAGYVHAGGIDKPLVTMDGRVPTYNWRGLPESSVWTNGSKADCSLGGSGCQLVSWPSANSIYYKPPLGGSGGSTPQWIGSLMLDGAGSTGMLYRRNRFYDPSTGQFTQQDPIGIAGGANVYGFAGGDPVNFSDPFGLCPCAIPVGVIAGAAGAAAVAAVIQAKKEELAAAVDAAVDAVADKINDFKYVTYTRTNAATGETYSGRTSGFGDAQSLVTSRAAAHPARLAGFGPAVVDRVAPGTAQGYAAIRGREQQLIDANGGAQSHGGTSANLIRGVSTVNPLAGVYHAAAIRMFGPVIR